MISRNDEYSKFCAINVEARVVGRSPAANFAGRAAPRNLFAEPEFYWCACAGLLAFTFTLMALAALF